ncbi:MAG: hypothetical protein F6K35_44320 [Okeania sp. SIO2H7]|nr:hypothetical protein [Okeania sp. SIO2H7]
MLKLTYTESGFYMERLAQSPELLVARRAMLAMRVGQKIAIEPSSAAFLLPIDMSAMSMLSEAMRNEGNDTIAICDADEEYAEVSLGGTWITTDMRGESGVFVTVLSDRVEFLLLKLWQESQTDTSIAKEIDR